MQIMMDDERYYQNMNLRQILLKTLLLLSLFVLFIPHITRTIRYDEAYTYIIYARSPLTALFAYTLPNNHLLNSFFIWVSTSIAGNSVIAIRFPAFMAGMIAFAYQYRLCKRLFKNSFVALISVLLLASMTLIANYMVEGRGYSLTVLITLIYVEFIFFGKVRLSRFSGRKLLLLTTLLVITLPTMLLLVFAMIVWIVYQAYENRRYKQLSTYFLPMIVGSMIGTLFYMQGILAGNTASFSDKFGYSTVQLLVIDFFAKMTPLVLLPFVLSGLLIGSVFAWFTRQLAFKIIFTMMMVALIPAIVQKLVTDGVLFPRSYIYILPFIAMLVAYGFYKLLEYLPETNYLAIFTCLIIFISLTFSYRELSQLTGVDLLNDAIAQNAEESDGLIIGCCLDFPIYYLYYVAVPYERPETFVRLIIIPTDSMSHVDLSSENGIPSDTPCIEEYWQFFLVFVCENTIGL